MTTCHHADDSLRAAARRWPGYPCWRELDVPTLARLAREQGHDFATALLHERLLGSPEQQHVITRLAEIEPGQEALPRVLIVPGAGYREFPENGADGQRVRRIAGPGSALIPVDSFGTLPDNAQTIIDGLLAAPDDEIILVSLSKGSADVRVALAHPQAGRAFARVRAWISLSGIPFGTALAGWLLQRPLRRWAVRLWCWYHGLPFALLPALDRDAEVELTVPEHLRCYHVVGFPRRHQLSGPRPRKAYDRLAAQGPSDGGGFLLGDISRLPGTIVPVWGHDHYLRGDVQIDQDIARLLALAARDAAPCAVPEG